MLKFSVIQVIDQFKTLLLNTVILPILLLIKGGSTQQSCPKLNDCLPTISRVVELIQQTGLYLTITEAVKVCLACEGLKTCQEYKSWQGGEGNEKLFGIVKKMIGPKWDEKNTSKSSTIATYQRHLEGYKIFKKCVNEDQVMNILNRLKTE